MVITIPDLYLGVIIGVVGTVIGILLMGLIFAPPKEEYLPLNLKKRG